MDTTPTNMGKYRLLERIGRGGMAEVLLAQVEGPAGFQKKLAIKRILPTYARDHEFVRMFLDEARLAALLNHPNIVQIFELGEHEGTYYVAMEYVDGMSLRALCRRAAIVRRPIPVPHAAKIISLVCEGLAYAHALCLEGRPLELVHRDISPENILVSASGAVKIVDFGVAKAAICSSHTQGGTLKGKVRYMAPEQIRCDPIDGRADVFALGVVFYELVTGMLPFQGDGTVAVMEAILSKAPIPVDRLRPDCPPAIARIISQALEKSPEARFADCRSMQLEIDQCLIARGELVGAHELADLVRNASLHAEITVLDTAPGRRLGEQAKTEIVVRPRRAQCPRCRRDLSLSRVGAVEVDGCHRCGGLWLDEGELQELCNHPLVLLACARRFVPTELLTVASGGNCPRCAEPLEPFQFDSLRGIQLDRCPRCRGVWLDHGEAEAIDARLNEDA
ncbi:MAG: protein kinase domain-containing protein [Myxococcales bacterium]|jgi:Zn-finger nucleic acid-binding protein